MTYSITGVEVFSTGKWNEREITMDHLESMVKAFNDHKKTYRPFMKLGHSEKQTLLENEGLPAAGWADQLYIKGQKLVADFMHIPKKVYELIEKKAYSKVSCEIYFDSTINGMEYPAFLSAVALLGAQAPAVENLDDILGMYQRIPTAEKDEAEIYSEIKLAFKSINTNNETISEVNPMSKTENEIKLELELKAKTDALDAQAKRLGDIEASLAKFQKANETLEADKLEAQKKLADAEMAEKKAKVAQFTTELVSEKLCTVAMKPLIEQLFEDKAEFSIGDKKASKQELIKEALVLFSKAKEVNFGEATTDETDSANTQEAQEAAVEKYMKENPTAKYKDAVKAAFQKLPNKIKLVQGE